jgi:uncharacterized membrane protein YkvA (DUF1232 family)
MIRFLVLAALGAVVYLWLHPPALLRTEWWQRKAVPAIVAGLTLLYVISPVDLIPGFGPFGLLDDLLVVLSAYWWLRRRLQTPGTDEATGRREQPRAEGATRWDPYAVLGVDRGASRTEITRAYREQMKRYHPDRVADLGEELRRVAHEKSIEIQRAYKEIG